MCKHAPLVYGISSWSWRLRRKVQPAAAATIEHWAHATTQGACKYTWSARVCVCVHVISVHVSVASIQHTQHKAYSSMYLSRSRVRRILHFHTVSRFTLDGKNTLTAWTLFQKYPCHANKEREVKWLKRPEKAWLYWINHRNRKNKSADYSAPTDFSTDFYNISMKQNNIPPSLHM